MPTTVPIQAMQAFTRGTTIYNPRNIPQGTTAVKIAIDRSSMTGDPVAKTGDARVAIAWSTFLSLDDGLSWMAWGGAGASGGDIGVAESAFTIALPDSASTSRQVAAVMAVTGAITLGIAATVFP